MKRNSWLVTWFAMHPWMPVVIDALKESGFEPMLPPAIWVRRTGSVRTPNIHLPSDFEPFIYARKGEAVIINQRSGIFESPPIPSSHKVHPTEKPIQLYTQILYTFCMENSHVCSPFAGSGNFLLAAANKRHSCLGIDMEPKYRSDFVAKATSQTYGLYETYLKGGGK